jgi:hypothetical protein
MVRLSFLRTISSRTGRDRRGAAAVLLAVMIIALLGVAAVTVDVSRLLAIRAELQTAVDAAALAGVIELAGGGGDASRYVAIDYANRNFAENDPVVVQPENVTFGIWDPFASTFTPLPNAAGANAIDVWASKEVGNFLAWALNILRSTAATRATAWAAAPVGETSCVKPWALPEELLDENNDNVVEEWEVANAIGREFVLKSATGGAGDELGVSGIPSFFYPVVLPPFYDASTGQYVDISGMTGANEYRNNIGTCNPNPVGVGDSLLVEPGNMPGPTVQGARQLCAAIIATYCYDANGELGVPLIAAFWNSDINPIGRRAVEVATIGGFRLMRVYPEAQHGVVVGRFERMIDGGSIGSGATTLIRPILVR